MAKQTINIGTTANDGTGDPLRTAFDKANDNFDVSYGLRNFSAGDGLVDGQSFTDGGSNLLFVDEHTTGTWQHVLQTYTFDAGTTTIDTYIDGVSQGTISTGNPVAASGINIGNARNSATNRAFDGLIDEFAAWDRVLTSEEITNTYNLGVAGQALTIPEPSSLMLLGLAGFGFFRRRRA